MTTVIGTQFSDLTKHEEEFNNDDTCTFRDSGKSHACGNPMTHYTFCPGENCSGSGRACLTHSTIIMQAKHTRSERRFKCNTCSTTPLLRDVILVKK